MFPTIAVRPRPSGSVWKVPCARCDGMGVTEREQAGQLVVNTCARCNGQRWVEVVTK